MYIFWFSVMRKQQNCIVLSVYILSISDVSFADFAHLPNRYFIVHPKRHEAVKVAFSILVLFLYENIRSLLVQHLVSLFMLRSE